jgi:hypothetical protein
MCCPFKRILKTMIALAAAGLPCLATALPPPEIDPLTDTRFFVESSYFNTEANYDSAGGSYTSLSSGRYYRLYEGHLGAEHWLTPDLSLLLSAGYASAESDDGLFTRTTNQATDLIGGVRYVVSREPVAVTPELIFTYPFHRVDEEADDVLTGEGTVQIFIGSWAEGWYGPLNPYGEAGFNYQDDGRASHFLYMGGVGWENAKVRLGGELYGSTVVIDDDKTDRPLERTLFTNQVNGGSWKFYAVNPSVFGARANVAVNLNDNFRLSGSFDHTLNGESTAVGWTLLARLEYNWNARENSVVNSIPVPRALDPEKRENQRFEPEKTEYDPTLFDEPESKQPPKSKKPRRGRKKPVNVNDALDDVQKSLEQ